mmetsp:Transcript_35138/g.88967  ORF Transcript_35138/g.88967 Transcript_35138/m.88967 type:complete len:201 (-) Transcript_35138:252-854(-)|eukprot:CAMPEP_0202875750 /NCGR_PEP_ID=MMETSP1391-20130828/27860_1 /ASSEMBLY_ACC=CAM_ASM_000867 /TAXON_ID=1034604 /ORGANISM="Chlamydomonas leiostraca, Strain SAG 11-49" /LENGTH=200 /DNA_ID=CAMNT_0049557477 /DNA_START=27 /DNA_END=629 /DNA_ORIENTATION=+
MQTSMMRGTTLRVQPFQRASAKSRTVVLVEANKKVQKKTKVILTEDVSGVGAKGEIKQVPVGYWRNFLLPNGRANIATANVLEVIRLQKEAEIRKALEEKAQAQSFANALATIGKFVIKKKTGERDQIYGSVQVSEISDAIYQQTGRNLAENEFTVPEIKAVGSYECTVRLHPEVLAAFRVVVEKEKNITIKTTDAKKKK